MSLEISSDRTVLLEYTDRDGVLRRAVIAANPHIAVPLDFDKLVSLEELEKEARELESPWARADREAKAQRERVLDSIAMEKAFRPMPLPRPQKQRPFQEFRIVDSAEKRERRKKNKAARKARKGRR